jgi:hypothetical protein
MKGETTLNLRGTFNWILKAGVLSTLAIGLSVPAAAQNPVEQFFRFTGTVNVTGVGLSSKSARTGVVSSNNFTVGRYNGKLGADTTALAAASNKFLYCTDINHTISTSATYDTLINLGTVDGAAERLRRANYVNTVDPTDPTSSAIYYMNNWKSDGTDPGLALGTGTTNFVTGTDPSPTGGGLASALADTLFPDTAAGTKYNDYLATSLYSWVPGSSPGTVDSVAGYAAALQRAAMTSYLVDSFLNANSTAPFTGGAGLTAGYTLAQYHGAVQLAIWEIVQDGYTASSTTWDTTGDLMRSSATAFANLGIAGTALVKDGQGEALVKEILDFALAGGTAYASTDNFWIQAQRALNTADTWLDHRQDFAFTERGPIPEPAFYQMAGLLAMGGVAFFRLRRKRK